MNDELTTQALNTLAQFVDVNYSSMDYFWNGGGYKPQTDELVRRHFREKGFTGDFDEYEFQQWVYDQDILNDQEMKALGMENYKAKKFLCVWGSGYSMVSTRARIKTVKLDFISESNGFDVENIRQIRELDLGGSVCLTGIMDVMSVVRLT